MTTIRHHPDDELLLGLAAGRLPTGTALVVAAHVEQCAHCRSQMRDLEAVGGVLLEDVEGAELRPDALVRTMAMIDAPSKPTSTRVVAGPPPLPVGAQWPKALAGCVATRWRWIGPGMRWSRITVPWDPSANMFLLRIAPGKYLPQHTHSELELTQVLYGNFHDGRAPFGAGDFDAADPTVHHQPVVQDGCECICLASVQGRVLFDGFIARQLGALVGM